MNKTLLAIIIGIFVVGGAAVYALTNKSENNKTDFSSTKAADESANHNSGNNTSQPAANSSAGGNETKEGQAQVDIQNFAYAPATLKIKKGSTVTWTNQDEAKHDITPDKGQDFEGSQLLAKGESYSYTFDEVGTFTYHCSPHPYMKASVEVVE